MKVMQHVASRQNFRIDDDSVIREIARDADGNLRKALLVFEALKMQTGLNGPITIAKPDWEMYCNKVGDMIIQDQSPARVMEVRTKLYELLSHCIPPTVILKVSCLRAWMFAAL